MKKLGWIIGTASVTVIVLVIELMIISKASDYETREKVVFAKVSIDEGNIITSDMLEIREIASELVTNGTVRSIEEAEAKVSAMKIEAGEIMLKAKLQNGDNSTIEVSDKSNRLFSIRFETDQANGWQLEKGQLVDLICIPNGDQEGRIFRPDENSEAEADLQTSPDENVVSPIYEGEAAAGRTFEEQMAASLATTSMTATSSEFAGRQTPGTASSGKAAASPEYVSEQDTSIGYANDAATSRLYKGEEEAGSIYTGKVAGNPVSADKALAEEYSSFTETKVLKGIRVAAIIGEDGRREDNKKWEEPQYISFEVTEKQAVFLAYVKYNGEIELAAIPKQE